MDAIGRTSGRGVEYGKAAETSGRAPSRGGSRRQYCSQARVSRDRDRTAITAVPGFTVRRDPGDHSDCPCPQTSELRRDAVRDGFRFAAFNRFEYRTRNR